jgi:hypothetical protein
VGPRTGLDNIKNRNILTLPGLGLQPLGHSSRSQSLYRLRSVIPYHLEALRKSVPAITILLVCSFVKAQRSNPDARICIVIMLLDYSNISFSHVRLVAPQKCRVENYLVLY